MKATIKMMRTILDKNDLKLTVEEIAAKYQETQDPRLLAAALEKTYKLALSISSKYYGITDAEVASYSVEMLDKALLQYNGKAKVTTYYATILGNKFREKIKSLNYDKRKIIYHSSSYEVMVENGFERAEEENELQIDLSVYKLTEREKKYCKMIIMQYTSKEVATELEVSEMTICNMRKKLRKKLAPLAL